MIAGDVLKTVRYALSDTKGQRWSTERLLSLLEDALTDVALKSKLFNARTFLKLQDSITRYDISEVAIQIRRIEFNNIKLPLLTHEEMDNFGRNHYDKYVGNYNGFCNCFDDNYLLGNSDWKTHTGTEPQAIIYDKTEMGSFIVYPIIENANFDYLETNGSYGLVTNIVYEDLEFEISDTLGDLDPPVISNYLYIYYTARQESLVDESVDLNLATIYKELLANFVIGKAFLDNMDTMSVASGDKYLALYENRLNALNDVNETAGFESTPATTYRAFE